MKSVILTLNGRTVLVMLEGPHVPAVELYLPTVKRIGSLRYKGRT
jgi:hypothetical protein